MKEIWKEIKGFDGRFSVSNYGRIRQNEITYISLQNKRIHHEEKIMEPFIWQSRYLRIDLISNKKENKYRLNCYIHKLVAEYFIGKRPEGYVIDHIDGNYLNNRADNLHYVTQKENVNNPITKKRTSESIKKHYNNLTDEERKLLGEKIKLRMKNSGAYKKISLANKNRIVIHKGTEYKRVKPEELEYYLNKGYENGYPQNILEKFKRRYSVNR